MPPPRRGGGGGASRSGGGSRGGSGGGGSSRNFEWDDEAFRRGLATAAVRIESQQRDRLLRAGLRIQNTARRLCPVDTGRLRSSIQMRAGQGPTGPFVEVGTNVEYAPYVEFGTRYMAARPYLRPAYVEVLGRGL